MKLYDAETISKLLNNPNIDFKAVQLSTQILNYLTIIYPHEDTDGQKIIGNIFYFLDSIIDPDNIAQRSENILKLEKIYTLFLNNEKLNLIDQEAFLNCKLSIVERIKLNNEINRTKRNITIIKQIAPIIDALKSLYIKETDDSREM